MYETDRITSRLERMDVGLIFVMRATVMWLPAKMYHRLDVVVFYLVVLMQSHSPDQVGTAR